MNTEEILKNQLTKPPDESRKWRAAMIGLKGIAGFFVVGAALMVIRPGISSDIATLVQFALTAYGGVVGVYLGAQGSVEFKTTAALEAIKKTEVTTARKIDGVVEEGAANAPAVRPFSAQATGE